MNVEEATKYLNTKQRIHDWRNITRATNRRRLRKKTREQAGKLLARAIDVARVLADSNPIPRSVRLAIPGAYI